MTEQPNNSTENTGQATGQTPAIPEAKFTQADLDRIAAKVRAEVRNQFSDYEATKAELEQRKAAEMTEAQKLQAELERMKAAAAEAERKAQEAELKSLRMEVASAKGLPATLAGLLQGTTKEELEAHAAIVLEGAKQIGQKPTPPDLDGAAGVGQRGTNASLTSQEIELAQKMGMTPEQYAKQKARLPGKR